MEEPGKGEKNNNFSGTMFFLNLVFNARMLQIFFFAYFLGKSVLILWASFDLGKWIRFFCFLCEF